MSLKQKINTEQDMLAWGAKLAKVVQQGTHIALYGNLGAGKTTLVRGFLRALGYQGAVKSPTYTLVETYTINDYRIHHFDLYRVVEQEELEYIGIRDYYNDQDICLIEWPEQGFGVLPLEDVSCYIEILGEERSLTMKDNTEQGKCLLALLNKECGDEE